MPVDVISRRSALTGVAVVAVSGVVGYVVARNSSAAKSTAAGGANAYGPAPGAGSTQALASLDQVPDGSGVILSDAQLVLSRNGEQVAAFSAVCTHQGCLVDSIRGDTVSCPCHGSQFDLRTGSVVNGPASSPLPPVPVVVRAGGVYRQ